MQALGVIDAWLIHLIDARVHALKDHASAWVDYFFCFTRFYPILPDFT